MHYSSYCIIELNTRELGLAPVEVEGGLNEAASDVVEKDAPSISRYKLTQTWLNDSFTIVSWWDRGIHECIIR